jgi:hypothetical protein
MRIFPILAGLIVGLCNSPQGICDPRDPNRMVAAYVSGEQLTSYCRAYLLKIRQDNRVTAPQAWEAALCDGYVAGVLDAINAEDADVSPADFARLCMPQDLNAMTAVEIVAKFLDGHPERRASLGYVLVREALAAAFPCR